MDEMKTLIETIEQLNGKKYTCDFEVVDKDKLYCHLTNELFSPEEVIIEKVFRFEGDSNPADMAYINAITAKSGTRGILIDAYGTYSNPDIDEFIKKVPQREENELTD